MISTPTPRPGIARLASLRTAALLAGLLLIASACGSSATSSTDVDASADQTEDQAASNQADNTNPADGEASNEQDSDDSSQDDDSNSNSNSNSSANSGSGDDGDQAPGDAMSELLGIPFGDDDAMEAYFSDIQRQAEEETARCMAAQGFEYTPVNLDVFGSFNSDIDAESREYAETYGFGITTNEFEDLASMFEDFSDPNDEYRASLSPGESDAYEIALSGFTDEEMAARFQDASGEDFDFTPQGCQGEAFASSFKVFEVFTEFGSEFEELDQRIEADPRLVAARAGWTGCMADGGFRFENEDDARASIQDRYRAITSAPGAIADGDDLSGVGSVEIGGSDDNVTLFQSPELTTQAQAEVDDLAVEEIALATASWDCLIEAREVERTVTIEAEEQFLADNGAAISALLDEG